METTASTTTVITEFTFVPISLTWLEQMPPEHLIFVYGGTSVSQYPRRSPTFWRGSWSINPDQWNFLSQISLRKSQVHFKLGAQSGGAGDSSIGAHSLKSSTSHSCQKLSVPSVWCEKEQQQENAQNRKQCVNSILSNQFSNFSKSWYHSWTNI